MFKEEYSLDINYDEVLFKIRNYLYNNENIMLAYIFGSFGTEDFTAKSDIDIAILTKTPINYSEILRLNSELEDIIGSPIDLNDITQLPPYIQIQVLMKNSQLFSKDDIIEDKYILNLNHWIKTELPFWRKLVSNR